MPYYLFKLFSDQVRQRPGLAVGLRDPGKRHFKRASAGVERP
jgi:hypothetical protein